MNTAMLTRTAVLGAGAALCLGVSAPALAHTEAGSTSSGTTTTQRPTLAQEQAWIDNLVTHRQQGLGQFAARVAADPRLTAAQKAAAAAMVAKAQAALFALKARVDAATSTGQVHEIVAAALAALPHPMWPLYGSGHEQARHQQARHQHSHAQARKPAATDVSLRSDATRKVTVHRHSSAWSDRDHGSFERAGFDPAAFASAHRDGWQRQGDPGRHCHGGSSGGGHHDGGQGHADQGGRHRA